MKTLSMVCIITLVILSAGDAFAFPGVYKAGEPSMVMASGRCKTRTISLDGTGFDPTPIVGGGLFILNGNHNVVDVTDCRCYDGTLTPAVWEGSLIEFDPGEYTGSLFVAMGNLNTGVIPSDNILLCDVTFCGGVGTTTLTIGIDTDPTYDMWINQNSVIYDSTIDAAVITVMSCPCPCVCSISGPLEVQANASGDPVTVIYTARLQQPDFCDNAPNFVYSDNCVHGSIDPNTGLLTVPAFTSPPQENCAITVTDTANTELNNGEPITCRRDIKLLAGDVCEGNFDCDQDQDSSDASKFKLDFGRSSMKNPCTAELPCKGDFNCDHDVDSSDAALFKSDFGRSNMSNPCPICEVGPWCEY